MGGLLALEEPGLCACWPCEESGRFWPRDPALACPGGMWPVRLLALEETTGLLGRHAGDAKCLLALEEGGLCVLACPGGEMHQIPPGSCS